MAVPEYDYIQMHLLPFSLIFILWIFTFYIFRLYDLNNAISNRRFMALAINSFVISGMLSALIFYVTPFTTIEPKTNMIIFIFVYAILFFIWRNGFNKLLRSFIALENVAIIGYSQQVVNMLKEFDEQVHLGFDIKFIFRDQALSQDRKLIQLDNYRYYDTDSDLLELIKKFNISNFILATDPKSSKGLNELLFKCLPLKINFINLHHFYENILGRVPIEIINNSWFLENLSEGNKKFHDLFIRVIDIIYSVISLIIILPLFLLIALFIKLDSRGEVIYKQTRVGKNGVNFTIYKFRTMLTGVHDEPTEENDNRITKVGSFLRKSRIDELPQLYNVLKGEMSFIGPRPERPELVQNLKKQVPYYNERLLIRPGITGWDQTSMEYHSPSYEDTMKKLQYDLYYIKNRTILLDLIIVMRTITTVLSRKGR